jgi:hypothetical protein
MNDTITQLLPVTTKNSQFPAYTNLRWQDRLLGLERVQLDYNSSSFEILPYFTDLFWAFSEFYRQQHKTSPLMRQREKQPKLHELLINDDGKVVKLGVDTNKEYLFFLYEKADKEMINFVDDFICMLIDA